MAAAAVVLHTHLAVAMRLVRRRAALRTRLLGHIQAVRGHPIRTPPRLAGLQVARFMARRSPRILIGGVGMSADGGR